MSSPPVTDLLRNVPALAHLDDADLLGLAGAVRVRRLHTGDVLYRQGDPGDSLCFLRQGILRVEHEDQRAKLVLGNIKPGEMLGELALLDAGPRSVTVVAASECELHELESTALERLERTHPAAASAVFVAAAGTVVRRIRQVTAQLEGLNTPEPTPAEESAGSDSVFRQMWARVTGLFQAPAAQRGES